MDLQNSALTRLPAIVTATIGREREIQEACALLRRENVRLLTLTGPGGVGKTRLSLEIARAMRDEFPDGCIFVSLGSLLDQEHVLPAIAQGLGVEQSLSLSLSQRLPAFLAEKQLLLILDNFEHLQGASILLAELLSTAVALKLLVTSRAPLHLYGEHEYAVPPLSVPDLSIRSSLKALAAVPSVELFIERAQAVRTTFTLTPENAPIIAEMCVRLDGLPLAIELAAARSKFLAPQELLSRLYSMLSGGSIDLPPRQRTLRATLDWSYALLNEEERSCFRRLSLLLGNWTLAAAEALCKGLCSDEIELFGILSSLVDKSLIHTVEIVPAELRFSFLRTIREYAIAHLQSCAEEEAARRTHALFFLMLIEQAQSHLRGAQQRAWLQRIAREDANIWAALRWLIEHGETELALRFGSGLSDFLLVRSELSEGHDWCEEILALPWHDEQSSRARARVLYTSGVLALMRSDLELAEARLLESGELAVLVVDRGIELIVLGMRAQVALHRGDDKTAQRCIERGLQVIETMEDTWSRGIFYSCAGNVASKPCDFKAARRYYQMSLKDLREVGDTRSEAEVLLQMGQMLRVWGKLRAASILYKRGLRIFQEVADLWSQAACLNALGSVARLQGAYVEAEKLLQECLALTLLTGNKREQVVALCELSQLAAAQAQFPLAQQLCKESLKIVAASGSQSGLAPVLWLLGHLALAQGDLEDAGTHFEQALKIARSGADKIRVIAALSGLGAIARQRKETLRAFALYKQALLFCREVQDSLGYMQLFEEFALLCWQTHLPEEAITLFSFGHSLRAVLELASVPYMQEQKELALLALRADAGETIYQECWRTGSTLNAEIALSEIARLHFSERVSASINSVRSSSPAGLTARELEVLRLVAAGYSDARIARELVLSPRTINAHLRSIYAKAGVSSRSAATRFAFEQKVVT